MFPHGSCDDVPIPKVMVVRVGVGRGSPGVDEITGWTLMNRIWIFIKKPEKDSSQPLQDVRKQQQSESERSSHYTQVRL